MAVAFLGALFYNKKKNEQEPPFFVKAKATFAADELHYLQLLAKQYPTVQAASTEIINLQSIFEFAQGHGAFYFRHSRCV